LSIVCNIHLASYSFGILIPSSDNSRPNVAVRDRQVSRIIGLKSFNNWIKSVLVAKFAYPLTGASHRAPQPPFGRVLDIGCGKGGDLQKWLKARIKEFVGIGISSS
jgi:mRNA (guanine-N7-)-methyltransferase